MLLIVHSHGLVWRVLCGANSLCLYRGSLDECHAFVRGWVHQANLPKKKCG